MAKKYSNKIDKFVSVADKAVLAEYLTHREFNLDKTKTINPEYVHSLLNDLPDEEKGLDIEGEIVFMHDIASSFTNHIQEHILNIPQHKNKIQWNEDDCMETILLRILMKDQNIYQLIYDWFLCDRCSDKLYHYPLTGSHFKFNDDTINIFKEDIKEYFKDKKQTDNCDIRDRKYKDKHYVLVLRGDAVKTITEYDKKKKRRYRIYRPAKEDVIVYDKEAGIISLSPSIQGHTHKLSYMNSFSKHILGSKEELTKEHLLKDNEIIKFEPMLNIKFYERTEKIRKVKLAYMLVTYKGENTSTFTIKSDDVLKSLEERNFYVSVDNIKSLKLEFFIGEAKRPVSFTLTKNGTSYIKDRKKGKIIEEFLRERKVISF